ncbi:MAG: type II secretion system protein GspL [Leptothrix sp. (in: b-proteobacteria)]
MSLLIVQLPPRPRLGAQAQPGTAAPGAEWSHVLSQDGSRVDTEGRCALALLPKASSVVVVLAASDVAFHRLAIPKAPAARLRAALRGLLEEQVLDDIEQLHVALGPLAQAGSEGWVAITDHAWLSGQVARIEASGRVVDRIVPASWPESDGSWRIDVQAQDPDGEGDAAQAALIGISSAEGVSQSAWNTSGRPGALVAALLPEPLPADLVCSASPAMVQATEAWLGRPVAVRGQAERLLAAAQGSWNLRQFDLAPRHRGATVLRDAWLRWRSPAWQPVRWGLAGLVAAQLIGLNAWAWQQRSELAQRRLAMTNLLRSTHPQVRAILDAPLQMQRETDTLRLAAGRPGESDLETLLQAAASAWPDSLPVQTLRYENAQLSLGAPTLSAEQTERLRMTLQPTGWRVEGGAGMLTLRRAPPGSAPPVAAPQP